MSNIDKHAVQAVADLKAGYTLGHADVAILNELARIALASLEAEPVAWLLSGGGAKNHVSFDSGNAYADPLREVTPLYTATPAPVSMKDHQIREMVNELRDIAIEYQGTQQLRERIARTVRAAMLQGAEQQQNQQQNIPENIPFDQWLSQQTGTIDVECGCVMTEVFFHWLRVAYEAGKSPVIPDGWKLVPIDPTKDMLRAGQSVVGFWLNTVHCYSKMLAAAPAAPQQEVNNG